MNIARTSALAGVFVVSGAAMAQHAVDFDHASGFVAASSGQAIGWQFDVVSAITATHLSFYDEGLDGLGEAHDVAIWAPDGTMIASATIGAGTSETLDGIWRVVDIADVVLNVGAGYIVGGYDATGADFVRFDVTGHTVDASLSFVDATFSGPVGSLVRPTSFSVASTGFYGPGFKVGVVPEPATMAALGLGAAVLIRRRRKA